MSIDESPDETLVDSESTEMSTCMVPSSVSIFVWVVPSSGTFTVCPFTTTSAFVSEDEELEMLVWDDSEFVVTVVELDSL